jgi:hypothetical protein
MIDLPFVYTQMFANLFNVIDKIPGGVFLQACMWCALPCTPLIEQNDAIELGIKESSILTASPAPWPSMKENNSLQNTRFHQK